METRILVIYRLDNFVGKEVRIAAQFEGLFLKDVFYKSLGEEEWLEAEYRIWGYEG